MQVGDRNTREAKGKTGPLSRECSPSGRCVTRRKGVNQGDGKELSYSQEEASMEVTVMVGGVILTVPRIS